jgi:hypothetical protein
MPVPEVLKFQLFWTVESDPGAMTVHYFRYTGGPPNAGNCSTMAASAVSNAHDAFNGLMPGALGMSHALVTDLTSDTSAQGEGGTPWAGTDGGGLLAPGTAVLVNHSIGRRYRGGKPRTYLPSVTSGVVGSDGLFTTTFVDNISTAWGSFVAAMLTDGAGCALTAIVNVSYFKGFTNVPYGDPTKYRRVPTPRASPVIDVITAHTVSRIVASQRRRNRAQ